MRSDKSPADPVSQHFFSCDTLERVVQTAATPPMTVPTSIALAPVPISEPERAAYWAVAGEARSWPGFDCARSTVKRKCDRLPPNVGAEPCASAAIVSHISAADSRQCLIDAIGALPYVVASTGLSGFAHSLGQFRQSATLSACKEFEKGFLLFATSPLGVMPGRVCFTQLPTTSNVQ